MKSHPGGALGQRLSCRVEEIMFDVSKVPSVNMGESMAKALIEMDAFKLGAVMVLDENQRVEGIITDGDIRHCVAKGHGGMKDLRVEDIMTSNPHSLGSDVFLYDALNLMEKHQITVLPITDPDRILKGILHLHDILGKGSFKYNGGSQ